MESPVGSRPPSPDLTVPPPGIGTGVYGAVRTGVATAFNSLVSGISQRSTTRGDDIIPPIQARVRPQDSMAQYTRAFDQRRTIAEAAKKLAEWSAAGEQRGEGGEQGQEDEEDDARGAQPIHAHGGRHGSGNTRSAARNRATREREEIVMLGTLGARHRAGQERQELPEGQQPGLAESLAVAAATNSRIHSAAEGITEEQLHVTREKIQYDRRKFHFAIVGRAGSGKSSLINAFLNRKPGEPGAARTGPIGTTAEICRFQDPGPRPPRQWAVWFDVPGVETLGIPHLEYFKNQGLYAFNAIILVIGDRFEEFDCSIMASCQKHEIPCIIVRSKLDQHIDNMLKERDEDYQYTWRESMVKAARDECRTIFREQTRAMVEEALHKADLECQKVFCVSRFALKSAYNGTPIHGSVPEDRLDEQELVDILESFAITRRYLY
ncbi:hypothetical protein P167DRAFT_72849 [Morchella conica CCBAS932]|uniref:IRG-type G domain-containing protein n=1 Tax=Morchella conica CCBAS932 TaxID=1392247 RepID=A0A3N4KU74_9PEZI|nr:hypothetical protein P167DRAFT_72849 [Morchella conica CCBAS932]